MTDQTQAPSISEQVEEAAQNPERYNTNSVEWPVGTILPFYVPPGRELQFPTGWCICAGQLVLDGPFANLRLPNLTDGRFLMGTSSSFGATGGNNVIPMADSHTHTVSIDKIGGPRSPNGFDAEGGDCRTNSKTSSSAGGHNHGGDNRPLWFGSLFMIKYK